MGKPILDTITDEELVARYRNSHDPVYIGELYLRYTHLVYGTCLKYLKENNDAKDATMQIFELLIRELKRHHITTFRPWLYTVVKNFCLMEFRKAGSAKEQVRKTATVFPSQMEISDKNNLDDDVEKETLLQGMERGLMALKEEPRKCLQLFYLENLSYKAIQGATGFTLNEIKSYIQNGKRNLKLYMTNNNG